MKSKMHKALALALALTMLVTSINLTPMTSNVSAEELSTEAGTELVLPEDETTAVTEVETEVSTERETEVSSEKIQPETQTETEHITEAQTEAKTEEPKNVLEYTDKKSDIRISMTREKDFADDIHAYMEFFKNDMTEAYIADLNRALADEKQEVSEYKYAMDLSVRDKDSELVEDTGKVEVRLYLKDAKEIDGYKLYHLKDDEEWETIEYGIDKEDADAIVFETKSFSPFVFAKTTDVKAEEPESDVNKTIETETPESESVSDELIPYGELEEDGLTAALEAPEEDSPFKNKLSIKFPGANSGDKNQLDGTIFDQAPAHTFTYGDIDGDGNYDRLSVLGDSYWGNDIVLEADFEVGQTCEEGELTVVFNQFFDSCGRPISVTDGQQAYVDGHEYYTGPTSAYWDISLDGDDLIFTNKVKMVAGATGHFQFGLSADYLYYMTDDFMSDIHAVMNYKGKSIKNSNTLQFDYEGYPHTVKASTSGYIRANKHTFSSLTPEQIEAYTNSYFVDYTIDTSYLEYNSIGITNALYTIKLPDGAEIISDEWTLADDGSWEYMESRDPHGSSVYLGKSVLVRYPMESFDASTDYEVEASIYCDFAYENANTEYYRMKTGGYGPHGMYHVVTDSYSCRLNDFGFKYTPKGDGYGTKAIQFGRSAEYFKGNMVSDDGLVFETGFYPSYVRPVDSIITFGVDNVAFNTEDRGYVLASEDEYSFLGLHQDYRVTGNRPYPYGFCYYLSYYDDDAPREFTANLELMVHTRDDADGVYNTIYTTELKTDGGCLFAPTDNTIDFPEGTTGVQIAIYDIPAGVHVYGSASQCSSLITSLKPTKDNYDTILPTEKNGTTGYIRLIGFIESWRSDTLKLMPDAENAASYTGYKGLGIQEKDEQFSKQFTLNNGSIRLEDPHISDEMSGRYIRRNYMSHKLTTPVRPYLGKWSPDFEPYIYNGESGYRNTTYLSVCFPKPRPVSISKLTIYDILPEYVHDISGDDFYISLSSYEITDDISNLGLHFLDGTDLYGKKATAYVKNHCTLTKDENFAGSGQTLLKYSFDFSDNPFVSPIGDTDWGFDVVFHGFVSKADYLEHQVSYYLNEAMLQVTLCDPDPISFRSYGYDTPYDPTNVSSFPNENKRSTELVTALLSQLDPNVKYSYDSDNMYVSPLLTASLMQCQKSVKTDISKSFVKSAVASPESEYTYRLLTSSSEKAKLTNMITYDVLEDEDGSQWKGTFVRVDDTKARKMGVEPVVYYATQDPGDTKITDEGQTIWSTDAPADLADVKAIAVDLRHTSDGEEFVLDADSSIYVDVIMKAPNATMADKVAINRFTTTMDTIDTENDIRTNDFHTTSDTTEVTLGTAGNYSFTINKIAQDTGKALKGAEFTLTGTTISGNEFTKTAVSDYKGIVSFKSIPEGTYTLRETAAPLGYGCECVDHTVVIDRDEYGILRVTITDEDHPDGVETITVVDPKVHILPGTGSMNGVAIPLAGFAIILIYGAYVFVMRRRRNTI